MDLFEHVERKAPEPTVLSVEALTRAITGRLTAMGTVSVEGEVSQPKRAASGHLYFDLKDSGARISCIAWRSTVQRLRPAFLAGAGLASSDPLRSLIRGENAQAVRDALARLSEQDREILQLRSDHQLAFGEIAHRLELPSADAARMRFVRALRRFADEVKPRR